MKVACRASRDHALHPWRSRFTHRLFAVALARGPCCTVTHLCSSFSPPRPTSQGNRPRSRGCCFFREDGRKPKHLVDAWVSPCIDCERRRRLFLSPTLPTPVNADACTSPTPPINLPELAAFHFASLQAC